MACFNFIPDIYVEFTNAHNSNPTFADVLDKNGTITAATDSTFEITNGSGGPLDGYVFRFTCDTFAHDGNFAYNGNIPVGGRIGKAVVLDDEGVTVATIDGWAPSCADIELTPVWESLRTGDSDAALTKLFGFKHFLMAQAARTTLYLTMQKMSSTEKRETMS